MPYQSSVRQRAAVPLLGLLLHGLGVTLEAGDAVGESGGLLADAGLAEVDGRDLVGVDGVDCLDDVGEHGENHVGAAGAVAGDVLGGVAAGHAERLRAGLHLGPCGVAHLDGTCLDGLVIGIENRCVSAEHCDGLVGGRDVLGSLDVGHGRVSSRFDTLGSALCPPLLLPTTIYQCRMDVYIRLKKNLPSTQYRHTSRRYIQNPETKNESMPFISSLFACSIRRYDI